MTNRPNLKIMATAYDENGEFAKFAIGIGKKWIGGIIRNGRFFEATIGPAKGKGLTPGAAAELAWDNFNHAGADRAFGFLKPAATSPRVSVSTKKKDRKGKPTEMTVLVDGKEVGIVARQRDGRYLAIVDDVRKASHDPMAASRLAWISKSGA